MSNRNFIRGQDIEKEDCDGLGMLEDGKQPHLTTPWKLITMDKLCKGRRYEVTSCWSRESAL